jgi:hypothetical protein
MEPTHLGSQLFGGSHGGCILGAALLRLINHNSDENLGCIKLMFSIRHLLAIEAKVSAQRLIMITFRYATASETPM